MYDCLDIRIIPDVKNMGGYKISLRLGVIVVESICDGPEYKISGRNVNMEPYMFEFHRNFIAQGFQGQDIINELFKVPNTDIVWQDILIGYCALPGVADNFNFSLQMMDVFQHVTIEYYIKGGVVIKTCSRPRCPLLSHSLVCSKNHLFIVGIRPICNKQL